MFQLQETIAARERSEKNKKNARKSVQLVSFHGMAGKRIRDQIPISGKELVIGYSFLSAG
jgi:hypothetical protein